MFVYEFLTAIGTIVGIDFDDSVNREVTNVLNVSVGNTCAKDSVLLTHVDNEVCSQLYTVTESNRHALLKQASVLVLLSQWHCPPKSRGTVPLCKPAYKRTPTMQIREPHQRDPHKSKTAR